MNIIKTWLIVGVAALCIMCFVMGSMTNQKSNVELVYYERPIYKTDPFQNYSNDEVRNAINYTVYYFNDPQLLHDEDYPAWVQWKDYERRVLQDPLLQDPDYNYWILSYGFGV